MNAQKSAKIIASLTARFGSEALNGPPTAVASRGARRSLAERGLRRRKACDRHAERRARYVIEPDLMTERHGGSIAAVLTADPELQFGPDLAPTLGGDPHQLADAIPVERDEGVDAKNSLGEVGAEKARSVVPADAERRLREIIGAEREELRRTG